MALIPLKDMVSIKRVMNDSNGEPLINAWGNPTYEPIESHKARIDESTKLVKNQKGYEVVSNTQILLNGAVKVTYEDELLFTDSFGNEHKEKPISVGTIKDLSSKVLFTEVSL